MEEEMIELRKFRCIDLIIILILSVIWIALNYGGINFFLLIFLTTLFILYIALLIRRIFAIALFFLIGLGLSLILERFGFISEYIIIFFICGLIFEIIAYFTEERYLLLILDAGISMALFPFIALIMAGGRGNLLMLTINLSILCFITGIIAAIFGLLVWLRIRGIRQVIEFIHEI